jgi:hypothetical protein
VHACRILRLGLGARYGSDLRRYSEKFATLVTLIGRARAKRGSSL